MTILLTGDYIFYSFHLFTSIYDLFVRVQNRDKTRSSSESQQIKAKYNDAPKSVVLIDSSGKTGCKMSNNSSDSEEDNLYSDVNNAFTLENELSKPDRSETASHVEEAKEKVMRAYCAKTYDDVLRFYAEIRTRLNFLSASALE